MLKTGKQKGLLIFRGNGFDLSFGSYYGSETSKRSREALNERKYAVGETDISYRVINHWDESKLLPDGMAQGGWRKFNFIEMAWLRVVQHLRDFGMPIKLIEKAKEGIMEWHKATDSYPYFEYYLATAMVTETDTYAVINREGLGAVASVDELSALNLAFGPQDLLSISLKGLVAELGLKGIPKSENKRELNENEAELIELLRSPSKEVKVAKKGEHISGFETTEVYPNLQSVKDLHKKFKDKNLYGEVTIKYENGKEQSAEVKTRRKL